MAFPWLVTSFSHRIDRLVARYVSENATIDVSPNQREGFITMVG
jgi:hypothetical protein